MEILAAGWVLPIDGAPLRDGRVAVAGGRVVWVGRDGEPGRPDGPVRHLGAGVLLPGLVNAHCHLELSHLAGKLALEAEGFVPWVEGVVASRGRHTETEMAAAVDAAISGLEARGTVAIGDVSNTLAHLERLRASSLRAVVFLELLAFDPARAEATLAWGEGLVRDRQSALREGLELEIAAHAPHSVSPELLRLLVARGRPSTIHLAESPEEVSFLADGGGTWPVFLAARGLGHVAWTPPGQSPVRYAASLGLLQPRMLAAHGVQLDDADRALLREHGVHVVLCPRSNANLGVGTADVPALVAAGVKLALGSDSLASVQSLDVLEDAVALRRLFPGLAPAAILEMATRGGAEALGFTKLGAIAPGRCAALAYAPAARSPSEPEELLLSGEAALEPVAIEDALPPASDRTGRGVPR
jgi:cytosine/adenosine deaminase-related metal-dependent hydrolase